tara:strand:- start:13460 stop:13699 length:240 start_codon:yes stop_codon:yes gene_type:complete
MPNITFTLSSAAVTRVTAALKGLYPIPEDENGDAQFSDNAWAKEKTRRWLKEQVVRYEQRTNTDAARDAVTEIDDADLT